jgi:hypothetical protein
VNEYGQRERIAEKVNAFIDQGVRVAIDDFGAGRDSLERLYELGPTTAVKVDRIFLQTCARRSDAASTLQHLIQQWRGAGVMSIAEGVESDALYEFARVVDSIWSRDGTSIRSFAGARRREPGHRLSPALLPSFATGQRTVERFDADRTSQHLAVRKDNRRRPVDSQLQRQRKIPVQCRPATCRRRDCAATCRDCPGLRLIRCAPDAESVLPRTGTVPR